MKQGKLEDRLQMRRLTVDDTAQYNALLRYAFQVTDNELASLGWNQKEMEREYLRWLDALHTCRTF